MIPSWMLLLPLFLLSALRLSAQVGEDVRLSPDDRPRTVSPTHRAASAVSLGDRTMVAWGRTVLNDVPQEEGVLMLGLLDGREWVADPEILAEYDPGKRIAVQLVAIDSLFLVLWEGEMEGEARGLSARAYHPDGRPATPRLRIGDEELTGIWSVPWMPGTAIIRRKQAPPISLVYESGQLKTRRVNPLVDPHLSFRVDRDTALWTVEADVLSYYKTMYDEESTWTMSIPPADSQASYNLSFIATVADSGFSLIILSTWFSEGYSRHGSNDSMRAQVTAFYFDTERRISRRDTLWSMLNVFGTDISGFGSYYTHRGAHSAAYCDGSQVIYLELESQLMRAGSPLGLADVLHRGAVISTEGETLLTAEESHASPSVVCTPSGSRRSVAYVQEEGVDHVRVSFAGDRLVFDAGSEQPVSARYNPRLVENDAKLYVVWNERYKTERLRRVGEFSADGLTIVDSHPSIHIPDLPNNHGCFVYSGFDESRELEEPGSLILNTQVWKGCEVIGGGNSQQLVTDFYPGVRILVIENGKYRSLLDTVCPPPPWGTSGTEAGYSTTGTEPDDRSMLILGEKYWTSTQSRSNYWVAGIADMNGEFLWRYNKRDLSPGYALPTGGRTWAAFRGDTVDLMDSSKLKRRVVFPPIATKGVLRFQSLPGPWIARTSESVQTGSRSLTIQLLNYESGTSYQRILDLHELSEVVPYVLTNPIDSSRVIVWSGMDGVHAAVYSSDFAKEKFPATRISETNGIAKQPSATFINDTLTVVWEDHRHGIPAIYGLQWKVEAVEGTNSVDQERTPATLDLSWRRSGSRSVPVE